MSTIFSFNADQSPLLDQAAQALRVDAELARGNWVGPLHGIPIGIKDIVAVAGTVSGAGSEWHSKLPPAQFDADVVASLRAAGAIILGKTVTTQFASFDPPPTRNPWNLDRTPGGSSSGSANEQCRAAMHSLRPPSLSAFAAIDRCRANEPG